MSAASTGADRTSLAPLATLWRILGAAPRGLVVWLIGGMALVSLTEGVGILMLAPLLASLGGGQNAGSSPIAKALMLAGLQPSLGLILPVFLVLAAFRALLLHRIDIDTVRVQHAVKDAMRSRCFAALLGADWRWLSRQRQSDLANVLLTGIGRVGGALGDALRLIAALFTLAISFAAALALAWPVALFAAACSALVAITGARQHRRAMAAGEDLVAANRGMQAFVKEGLAGLRQIKISRNEARYVAEFDSFQTEFRERQLSYSAGASARHAGLQLAGALVLAALLYLGVVVWRLDATRLLPAIVVFGRLIPIVGHVRIQVDEWIKAVPAISEAEALLAHSAAAAEPSDPGTAAPMPLREKLTLADVRVAYPDRSAAALDGVTLEISANQTTAIIGQSGSGKSTLADVLMGLIEPDSGRLTVDNALIAGAARMRWRRSVSYVQQDAFLFNDTVRCNLLWGAAQATDADLERVLALASAQFVLRLPKGLDTEVGDGGVRLSGGERQRLALARALLGRPSLLILDEATSALDPENEAAIRRALAALNKQITIVIIGHRLAFLDEADHVIELKDGRVTADDGGLTHGR